MKIGPMRQRVTIQTATETLATDGQPVPDWADVGTYWAAIRTPNGREVFNAAQQKALLSHVVEMRYIGPIEPHQRITHDGRIFDITYVDNVEMRNRSYLIYVIEVVGQS